MSILGNINTIEALILLMIFSVFFVKITKNIPIIQLASLIIFPCLSLWKNIVFYVNHSSVETYRLFGFISELDIRFYYTNISNVFLIMVSFLWLITNIFSIGYAAIKDIEKDRFFFLINLSILAVTLLAISGNLLTLFVSYEILTVVTYFLVAFDDKKENQDSGTTYFTILFLTSSSLFLIGIAAIYSINGVWNFGDHMDFSSQNYISLIPWILFVILYGIAKSAVMPAHKWLPEAMTAHTPVSGMLHGVAVVKGGILSMLYVIVYCFDSKMLQELKANAGFVAEIPKWLCGISAVFGSICAIKETKIKKILAYSTIANLGYMSMVIFSCYDQMPRVVLMQVIAHGLAKINMFFVAGILYLKYHISEAAETQGLWQKEKILVTVFGISALSLIGLPPTIGLISKINVFMYTIQNKDIFMTLVIAIGTILSCYYLMPLTLGMIAKSDIDNHVEDPDYQNLKKYYYFMYFGVAVVSILIIMIFCFSIQDIVNMGY